MSEALANLRSLMNDAGFDAYFLPHNDFHNSEYLGKHDQRASFISGFKGSNSQILITKSHALLWTDGRYWIAAKKELFEGWEMMKMGRNFPSVFEWISQNLPKGSKIAFDPSLVSASTAQARQKSYHDKGYEFVPHPQNLINAVWTTRPIISQEKVFIHELQYAGATVSQKLDQVLKELSHNFLFTSVLDDIAWLLNLRGKDIEYNPLFFSYLLINKSLQPARLTLFVHGDKVSHLAEYLSENHVDVQEYEAVHGFLQGIEDEVVVDEGELNFSLYQNLKRPVNKENIIAKVKAVKNEREIRGFEESHIRDAVAMAKYLSWLEEQLNLGVHLTEWTAALELDRLRGEEALNMGLSFENISSSGPNAAIIHYAPTESIARDLSLSEIYLLDSGGQYLDGTIDTTRTLHFGTPTDREKECSTRVLLGNLDLERARWPKSARLTGGDLDVLARRRLWEVGLDYNHATGHGVGYFLNVHEGPHYLCKGSEEVFKVGMNITNEPGYYEEGSFGIRIENVLFIVESQVEGFVEFKNITLVPYDKKLIDMSLLNKDDVEYINQYHKRVWETVGKVLEERGETRALNWLRAATSEISL